MKYWKLKPEHIHIPGDQMWYGISREEDDDTEQVMIQWSYEPLYNSKSDDLLPVFCNQCQTNHYWAPIVGYSWQYNTPELMIHRAMLQPVTQEEVQVNVGLPPVPQKIEEEETETAHIVKGELELPAVVNGKQQTLKARVRVRHWKE